MTPLSNTFLQCFLEESHYVQHTLKEWTVMIYFLRVEYQHISFGVHIPISMDSVIFILYFVYCYAQRFPDLALGALYIGSSTSLKYLHQYIFGFLELSLLSSTTRRSRFILPISCPVSEELWFLFFFFSFNAIRNQDVGSGCNPCF